MTRLILLGLACGVLIALLRVLEYKHLVLAHPGSLYGGAVAVLFAAVGLYMGRRWGRARETAPKEREAAPAPPPNDPATPEDQARRLGLTPREHEVLVLIADGLSNREIAERLFVSENTVKTHCSRVFEKLQVGRRVQAVRRAHELGLVR